MHRHKCADCGHEYDDRAEDHPDECAGNIFDIGQTVRELENKVHEITQRLAYVEKQIPKSQ